MAIHSPGIPRRAAGKFTPRTILFCDRRWRASSFFPRLGQSCGGRIHAVLNRATWPVVVDGILCRLSDFGAVAYVESKNAKRAHPFSWCCGKAQVRFRGFSPTER